jgi:RsiW-degrading membrane proteinase PrsW (M82 family)
MGFAVFMGAFYGRAKVCEVNGNIQCVKRNIRTGLFISILFHGFFNACLVVDTTASMITFIAFAALMYIVVFRRIKSEAASDVKLDVKVDFNEKEED